MGLLQIEGAGELKRALAELPKRTGKAVQTRVLLKSAQPVVALAKQLAPKDQGVLAAGITATTKAPRGYRPEASRAFSKTLAMTGDREAAAAAHASTRAAGGSRHEARQAFISTLKATGSKDEARAAAKAEGPGAVRVFIGPPGGPGKKHVDIWQEFGTKRMPAHPYLRPAWDALKKSVLDSVANNMKEEIKKATDRLERRRAKGTAGKRSA